jgi:hypothetical protein
MIFGNGSAPAPSAINKVDDAVSASVAAAAPQTQPDFDTRKMVNSAEGMIKKGTSEVEAVDSSPEFIAAKEAELKVLIAGYDASLDDPAAKKAFEQEFKVLSGEYKKAILAKLKLAEI